VSEEKLNRALQEFKQALLVVFGIALSLLVISLSDSTSRQSVPWGWSALWVATTLGSIPLGVVMLIGSWWRKLPLAQRRGPAMGFLLVGLFNFVSLSLELLWETSGSLVICPIAYGLLLLPVYVRIYNVEDREKEELFP
jgi:hypothetical protein